MELRQLAYFVAVAEEASFTRGARRAHVVQSTVSAAVALLEHELGQSLFRRSGHRIELTEAGALVLDRARLMLRTSHDVKSELQSLDGMIRGNVTLGTALSTGTYDLASALKGLRRTHPGIAVRVQVSQAELHRYVERVMDGTFDIAVIPDPEVRPAGLDIRPVGTLELVLTAALDSELPETGLTVADLANTLFIDFPVGWANRIRTDELFARAAAGRDVAIEVVDTAMAIDLVRGGLGVAFLPKRLVDERNDLRVITLDEPLLKRVLVVAKAATPHSPAAETVHAALLRKASDA